MFKSLKSGFYWIDLRTGDKRLSLLIISIIFIGSTGIIVALFIFVASGLSDGIFHQTICFQKKCIENGRETFGYAIDIISGTVSLLVAMATIGGIIVALLSYLHSTGTSAFANHISQLAVFHSYLTSQITKNYRISPTSLDIFYWYNLIYPDAVSGTLSVSVSYELLIEKIRLEIVSSNESASTARSGSFRYVDHQNRMIIALSGLGIKVDRQPRVDFFEIEKQIFSLIRSVNFAFCRQSSRCDLPEPRYF